MMKAQHDSLNLTLRAAVLLGTLWLLTAANLAQNPDFKLTAGDAASSALYGWSVTIDGGTAVVGNPHYADVGGNAGAAYLYGFDGVDWLEIKKLLPQDHRAGQFFGNTVAVSAATVAVGAQYDDENGPYAGAVYIFDRDAGGAGHWGEVLKLLPGDIQSYQYFGTAVWLDGDRLIAGSHNAKYDGVTASGAAYIFDRDPATGIWSESARLIPADPLAGDQFGWSVCLAGDWAVVGAPGNDDPADMSGAAYLFHRNAITGAWEEIDKITAGDARAGDRLGYSVSLYGETVLLGAPQHESNPGLTGAAYVYAYNSGSGLWEQVSKLTGHAAVRDAFGYSVALNDQLAVIGANRENATYVFDPSNWSELYRLTTADPSALFGQAVALDSYQLLSSDPYNSFGGLSNAGAVYVYDLYACLNPIVLDEQKISATSGEFGGQLDPSDFLGSGVASLGDLDGDGIADLAVGAYGDDDGGDYHGAVWVLFLNSDGTVKAEQKISETEGGFSGVLDDGDKFGTSVAALGDLNGDNITDLAVGAIGDDDGGNARGAVWILFLDNDGTVQSQQKISDIEGNFTGTLDDLDEFGISVTGLDDLDHDGVADLAVGAGWDDDGQPDVGAVWILFLNSDGTVKSHQKISATAGGFSGDLYSHDRFGFSLDSPGDLDGDGVLDLAVGAYGDYEGSEIFGAVWMLFLNDDGTVKAYQKIDKFNGNFTGHLDDRDLFGRSVSFLGDLDGDGVSELAVGAAGDADGGGPQRGAVWILYLNADGTVHLQHKISDVYGGFAGILDDYDLFGWSLTAPGDINGDGIFDLVVGALEDDDGPGLNHGAVWLLHLNGEPAAPGAIGGRITVDGTQAAAGVIVKLIDPANGLPAVEIEDQFSDGGGYYLFSDVAAGSYQVEIVVPLGYALEGNNPRPVPPLTLSGGETETVDFDLSGIEIANAARGKGFWKHQFDVHLRGRGHAHVTVGELTDYIGLVQTHYTPHFPDIFDGVVDFAGWQAVLSVHGNAGMEAKAKAQLAALTLNLMSLKLAQHEEVTADGRTAGDVLTYASELLDGDPANGEDPELTEYLAEQVNQQQTIAAGLVNPSQSILYKPGTEPSADPLPAIFFLSQNYPNPFNPATEIRFQVAEAGLVKLVIYDMLGRKVRTLMAEEKVVSTYTVRWDGRNDAGKAVAGGVYLCRMTAGDFSTVRKMILMR